MHATQTTKKTKNGSHVEHVLPSPPLPLSLLTPFQFDNFLRVLCSSVQLRQTIPCQDHKHSSCCSKFPLWHATSYIASSKQAAEIQLLSSTKSRICKLKWRRVQRAVASWKLRQWLQRDSFLMISCHLWRLAKGCLISCPCLWWISMKFAASMINIDYSSSCNCCQSVLIGTRLWGSCRSDWQLRGCIDKGRMTGKDWNGSS